MFKPFPTIDFGVLYLIVRPLPRYTLFPYTTLFRSFVHARRGKGLGAACQRFDGRFRSRGVAALCRGCGRDRKSTRLNSSHSSISYAVFCLKKKKINNTTSTATYIAYEFGQLLVASE